MSEIEEIQKWTKDLLNPVDYLDEDEICTCFFCTSKNGQLIQFRKHGRYLQTRVNPNATAHCLRYKNRVHQTRCSPDNCIMYSCEMPTEDLER